MKKLLASFLVFSLLMNAYLVIKEFEITTGEGQYQLSPSEELSVNLSSLRNMNHLASDKETYAMITVHSGLGPDNVIREIKVYPIDAAFEGGYRLLENPIEWSSDETKFTVTTPDFTITVNMGSELAGIKMK